VERLVRWSATLTLGLAPTAAVATTPAAYLDLVVNGLGRGQVLVFLDSADVRVRRVDLGRAGLEPLLKRRAVPPDSLVSLLALARDFTWKVDEERLELRLTLRADDLSPTVIRLGPRRPSGIRVSSEPAAFLHYEIRKGGSDPLAYVAEWGLSWANASLAGFVTSRPSGAPIRGTTALTFEEPSHLRRWVVGDQASGSGVPGGHAAILGVGVARDFGLDPYRRTLPSVATQVIANGPSEVETWLNGRLLHRQSVPPGPVAIEDVPGGIGQGTLRTVIRDRSGTTREVMSSFHLSPRVLAAGLSEYGYAFGLLRLSSDGVTPRYRGLGFAGGHRVGLTDHVTAGAFFDAGPGLVNGGPSLAFRLPRAEIELTAAGSVRDGAGGGAASVAWSALGQPVGLNGLCQWSGVSWGSLGSDRGLDQPLRFHGNAGITALLGSRAAARLRVLRTDRVARAVDLRGELSARLQLARNVNLQLQGSRAWNSDHGAEPRIAGQLTWVLGAGVGGELAQERRGDASRTALRLHRSPGARAGIGYRVERALEPGGDGSAVLEYQNTHGRYEMRLTDGRGRRTHSFGASGGIVATTRGLHCTRSARHGFAVVRVGGLRGVRTYFAGHEIGRTNGRGELVIPDLVPHFANRVSIEPRDVPPTHGLGTSELLVAPSGRGAAIARFDVRTLRSVSGRLELELDGWSVVPAYGELVLSMGGRRVGSPLGKQGEFYFEDAAAGRYDATILCGEGTLTTTLEIPSLDAGHHDLGVLRCRASR
jgi:outer membrane usher protein